MSENRRYSAEQVRGIDAENRRVTVVISTYDIDSYNSRIDQNGWDFSTFVKNPVIPLSHDDRGYTGSNGLPVAKGIPDSIRTMNQITTMDIEFPKPGVFPLADTVFELVKNGFLNAVSVGFEPIDYEDVDEEGLDGLKTKVRVYRKQRLLETSIVTIPSNSNALVQRAKKMNADETVIRRMTEQLEGQLGEARSAAEKEEFTKYKSYFEKKQPANRASTKALEKFFKARGEKQPDDEVEAWNRMTELVGEVKEVKPEIKEEIKPIEEVKPEAKAETPTEKPEVKEEAKVEVKEEAPIVTEPAPEEQKARTAFVQLPLAAAIALRQKSIEAARTLASEALKQGKSKGEVIELLTGFAASLRA